MAAPILTPALTRLRSGFNVAYPGRSKASDGWIGDRPHQGTTSGHNPDDTPGVSAERSDADSIPEVRAIDVDVDLMPGNRAASRLAMYAQIRRIIATPRDRRRLIYIIFDGLIWSASRDWASHTYTGSNKHREHAHFSGDPDYDNDGSAWSVETGDSDVVLDTAQAKALAYTNRRVEALGTGQDDMVTDPVASTPQKVWAVQQLKAIGTGVSSAVVAANDAKAEAALAKNLAGQAGIAATDAQSAAAAAVVLLNGLAEKVDELLARPPQVIDYRELALALLQVIREEEEQS